MPTDAEALIVGILRELGRPATTPEIRRALREIGRTLTEEHIQRECQRSRSIRAGEGARFGLLSQFDEFEIPEIAQSPYGAELTLVHLPEVLRGSYVAFDLETTGVSPEADAIIQVGAVRVEEGEPTGIFFEPSNPGQCRLDPSLRAKLDIAEDGPMDRLIRESAPFADIFPRFMAFAGNLVLVAHNGASLDVPFLRRQGLAEGHASLDSLELACLVLPSVESRSLEALVEVAGYPPGCNEVVSIIESEKRVAGALHHNALYDATVLHLVVQWLVESLQEQISASSPYGRVVEALLAELFASSSSPSPPSAAEMLDALKPRGFPPAPRQRAPGPSPDPIRVRDRFHDFVTGSGHDIRQGQVDMVEIVARTLTGGGTTVVEAPTGIGKSMALAYPAAVHAVSTGQQVLIATHTRNLQDQLVNDLEGLRVGGLAFGSSVLKGRGNYLCVTALVSSLGEALEHPDCPLDERYCLTVLTGWALQQAESGGNGDIDTFGFPFYDRLQVMQGIVKSVRAERQRCRSDRCRETLGCYRGLARAEAKAADVLVVNHALWLSDTLSDLPTPAGLLFDEAHELEDAATSALTQEVGRVQLQSLLSEILAPGDRMGILPRMLRHASPGSAVHGAIRAGFSSSRQARQEANGFGVAVADFLRKIGLDPGAKYGAVYRIRGIGGQTHPTRWRGLSRACGMLDESLQYLERLLESIASLCEAEASVEVFAQELQFLSTQLAETRTILRLVMANRDPRFVPWLEASASERGTLNWAAKRAPVNVGEELRTRLEPAYSVLLTSATLTTRGGEFGFLLGRLGLDRSVNSDRLFRLPPAFNYKNALLVMTRYLDQAPQASSMPFYIRELADEMETLLGFTEGRALLLFAARDRMNATYEHLVKSLGHGDIAIHRQGSGSSDALRRMFRDDEHSVLLGLKSFWQGVDVPGPACSIVVIEKLPFPSFSNPIVEARREATSATGLSEFEDYLLPLALLQFKQGFGRLLRSPDDRGAVLFMDRRIHSRSYKVDLLATLSGYSRNPDAEESRRETYRAIAEHLPAVFAGRNVAELLAALPEELLSEVATMIGEWNLAPVLTEPEYQNERPRILEFMSRIFRFSDFRSDEQEQIIHALLTGKDVLGLLPTGSGKSLTFQLPALLRRGLTLVVSPLIALMRDQVEKLHALKLDMVDAITSHITAGEREEVLRRARSGKLRLLYVSPERLQDPQLQATLEECTVVQVAVDEAHCVSMWGPTFRPDYVGIAPALAALPSRPPIAALTATATPDIRDDIIERLQLQNPVVVQGSFDRPELRYVVYSRQSRVHQIRSRNDKFMLAVLLATVAERKRESMIVYTATTRTAEEVARKLSALGFSARAYHGRMEASERSEVQELFLDDHVNICVATKAFGMGIDKPDVRYVVHYDIPGDLESYMQEAGRAGRDGKPAYAVLLYHPPDLRTQEFFIESLRLGPTELRTLMDAVSSDIESGTPVSLSAVSERLSLEEHVLRIALFRLEELGWLTRVGDAPTEASLTLLEDRETLADADLPADMKAHLATLLTAGTIPVLRRITVSIPETARLHGMQAQSLERLFVNLASHGLATFRPFERAARYLPGPRFGEPIHGTEIEDTVVERRYAKLQSMIDYGKNQKLCRRHRLLSYLGEKSPSARCDGCDVCVPGLNVPWGDERQADIANPSLLFDPRLVALQLIDANIARSEAEQRAPLGRNTLSAVLAGNAYGILKNEVDPHIRKWKERRLRSFNQWGLLASLKSKYGGIDGVLDTLEQAGLVEACAVDADIKYTYLRPTDAGCRAILEGIRPMGETQVVL